MKRVIPYVMLFFLLALYAYLSGCLIYRVCFPISELRYGVWKSEDPDLVMDINPEFEGFDRVIYTQENGDVIELSAIFSYAPNLNIVKEHEDASRDSYFFGSYKIKGDKLTLTLTNQNLLKLIIRKSFLPKQKNTKWNLKKKKINS